MRALGEQYKWLLIVVDDYTRFSWCYGLATKDIGDVWASAKAYVPILEANISPINGFKRLMQVELPSINDISNAFPSGSARALVS
jgi:hypothetical protein